MLLHCLLDGWMGCSMDVDWLGRESDGALDTDRYTERAMVWIDILCSIILSSQCLYIVLVATLIISLSLK